MQIPTVVKERTTRVQASIPVSQADDLKALAVASGVPVARAVHYAVERLLEVARQEGALAVGSGLAPQPSPDPVEGSVAEVAEALDLRMPESASAAVDSVSRDVRSSLAPAVGQDAGSQPESGHEPASHLVLEPPVGATPALETDATAEPLPDSVVASSADPALDASAAAVTDAAESPAPDAGDGVEPGGGSGGAAVSAPGAGT